jgi:hypothetical protein
MKDIFCTKEQKVTAHKGEVDANGEFLFTCQTEDCGRFVKFPADTNVEQFNQMLAVHEEQNKGQVSVEAQEARLQALLAPEEAPTQE